MVYHLTFSSLGIRTIGSEKVIFESRLGGGVKVKTTKSVVLQQVFFHLKALFQKRKVEGGKSIHFLENLFKTYSKINVW